MGVSSRSATAIHVLTRLAHHGKGSLTSTDLAQSLASNPVLVRRVLGNLRDAGLVSSVEGRGGGWTLARPSGEISLLDAYRAVETGPVLSRHAHPPSAECEIGRHMQAIIDEQFRIAERVLEEQLGRTNIDDLRQRVLDIERDQAPSASPA